MKAGVSFSNTNQNFLWKECSLTSFFNLYSPNTHRIMGLVGSIFCEVDEGHRCIPIYNLFLCCEAESVAPAKIKTSLWAELSNDECAIDLIEFKANGVTKLTEDNFASANGDGGFLIAQHTITENQVPAVTMVQVGKSYIGLNFDDGYGDFLYAHKVAFAYFGQGYVQVLITGEVSESDLGPFSGCGERRRLEIAGEGQLLETP